MQKLWSWLFGGNAADVITATGNAIDAATTSDDERDKNDLAADAQVRAFATPGVAGGFIGNVLAAVNSAIRPFVTLRVILGLTGDWKFQPVAAIDPMWQTFGMIIIGFWFGGRAMVKDVPMLLASLQALRDKAKGR